MPTTLEEAQATLLGLKALCASVCAEANAAVAALDPEARAHAAAALHVQTAVANGADPVAAALAGGKVTHEHLSVVANVAAAVRDGKNAAEAAGATSADVAVLQAAADAHEPHRADLEAAYAAHALTTSLNQS